MSSRPRADVPADIPDGIAADAADTWPPRELIDSFLGSFDFSPLPTSDPATAAEEQEEARQFRDVLGRFGSGVTVVTATTSGGPVGMTCQSFSSVSLRPALVMFVPAKTSRAWPAIRAAGHFTVNLLSSAQEEVSNQFARSGVDKYAGVSWSESSLGDPRLEGSLAWIDCHIHAVHEAGDHYLVIGRVEELTPGDAEDPLLFYRSAYHRL